MIKSSHMLFPLALLVTSACQQATFFLGAFTRDAGAPDAEMEPDDTSEPWRDSGVGPSRISVSLSAHGRNNVSTLTALCGSDCTEVRVKAQGGLPPYEVVWDDGKRGMARTLCADPTRARSATVSDASGGVNAPTVLALGVIDHDACTDSQPAWRVCFAVDTLVENPCPDSISSALTAEIVPSVPALTPFSIKTVLRGERVSALSYVTGYALSADCNGASGLDGFDLFRGSDGDDPNLFAFSGQMQFDTRYFAIDASLLLGLGSEADAGLVGEAESVMVCEDRPD
jgi:hypothetical protein